MLLRRYMLNQNLSCELNTSVGGYVIVLEVTECSMQRAKMPVTFKNVVWSNFTCVQLILHHNGNT